MRDQTNPRAIDLAAMCRDAAVVEGSVPLTELPRLCTSLFGSPGDAAEAVWSAQGSQKLVTGGEAERWLHLRSSAEVTLQCQRCLQAMRQPLAVDRRFRFVRNEQEAARLDEEIEDDVLELPARLDLMELLEDELILALPIVPRHEGACPEPLPLPADTLVDEAEARNPFAALAALRKPS